MRVDGQCHCGDIAFTAEIDETAVTICHCTDCQTLTGTAFRVSAPAPAASLRFVAGTPKTYVKTAESGNRRAQGFCGRCGTPIYSATADTEPTSYGLRVGTLKQREALMPRQEIWCQSALGWMPRLSGTETFEREQTR